MSSVNTGDTSCVEAEAGQTVCIRTNDEEELRKICRDFYALARKDLETQRQELQREKDTFEEQVQEAKDAQERREKCLEDKEDKFRKMRENWETERCAMDYMLKAQQTAITLNVGGHKYKVSLQTLLRRKGTFFEAMFSGRWPRVPSEDGSYFIDRNGVLFQFVLEYLRNGVKSLYLVGYGLATFSRKCLLKALKLEFKYFAIDLVQKADEAIVIGCPSTPGTRAGHRTERLSTTSVAWKSGTIVPSSTKRIALVSLGQDVYAIEHDGTHVFHRRANEAEWEIVCDLPSARRDFCVVGVGGSLYVIGGTDVSGVQTGSLWMYTPEDGSCQMINMPFAVYDAEACAVGSVIYLIGGLFDGAEYQEFHTTMWSYDVGTEVWAKVGPIPTERRLHATCAIGNVIYLAGGEGCDETAVNTFHSFDTTSLSWKVLPSMKYKRVCLVLFALGSTLYVAGGSNASVEKYDMETGVWKPASNMAMSRNCSSVCVVQVERNFFDVLIKKA